MPRTARNRLLMLLAWVALAVGGCAETRETRQPDVPHASPDLSWSEDADLRVSLEPYPLVYDDPEQFLLEVFFENRSDYPLIVLPSLLRRQYRPMDDSGEVTYLPAASPVRASPWDGAFTVNPGEIKAITLMGMEDGDGSWELGRGFYRLSVRYFVTEDLAADGEGPQRVPEESEAMVWIGDQESEELTVRYEPPAPAGPGPAEDGAPRLGQRRPGRDPF